MLSRKFLTGLILFILMTLEVRA